MTDVAPRAGAARSAGVLVHPTSLPGPLGTGDLGASALALLDFLAQAGQTVWQVLPVHPPGPGNSPYQGLSAFAGSGLLVDPSELVELGLLTTADLGGAARRSLRRADHDHARRARSLLLVRAFEAFERGRKEGAAAARELDQELRAFQDRHAAWLGEWTLYAALKAEHEARAWTRWTDAARDRTDLAAAAERLRRARELHAFVQLLFDRQWRRVRAEAAARGIRILGDLPMFVAHDSADVWSDRALFRLDAAGEPTHVSGAPPDEFNRRGQVWGHPLFHWDVVRERAYDWWIARVRRALELFDEVRLDHFVGYRAAWEVPHGARSAAAGAYGEGPGAELFGALSRALGPLPLVAEDLGDVTPEVEALRAELAIPGMRVLQFGFGGDPATNGHLPHLHPRDCVAYTGTHDNDTLAGWLAGLAPDGDERRRALTYAGGEAATAVAGLLRQVWLSPADTALAPVQDLLGLPSSARMNRPGTAAGNWRFRLRRGELSTELAERTAALTEAAGRAPKRA